MSNTTTMRGTLSASNAAFFASNVTVLGLAVLSNAATVHGTFSASNQAFFAANVTMAGMSVLGTSVLSNTVAVHGRLSASNSAVFASNVTVIGPVVLSNDVAVHGRLSASNLAFFASNVTFLGPSVMSNAVTCYGSVAVSNAAHFSSSVTMSNMSMAGYLGIGTTLPTTPLHVSGKNSSGVSIFASDDIVVFSDLREKSDITRIDDALSKLRALGGYTYRRESTGERRHAGVIAQEVQAQIPEVVHAVEGGLLSVAYGNLIALVIEAVKELADMTVGKAW
jgi:hypothetical protein